jgi:hypothetical protein
MIEADIRDQFEDLLAEQPETPRVAAGGLVIFVDQRFQILQRTVDSARVSGGVR